MKSRSILAATWEIKHAYQSSLALGIGISAFVHLAAAIAILILASNIQEPVRIIIDTRPTGIDFIPPVVKDPGPSSRPADGSSEVPSSGDIIRVPDIEAPDDINIATQADLDNMMPTNAVDITNDNVVIDTQKVVDELLPPPGAFTPYDTPPTIVTSVAPEYPALAGRANVGGTVFLEVLVDKNGNVRDVTIVKSTNKEAGFEQAAMDAAWKTVWKPAVSNGHPIAVRVTYSVIFKPQK